MWACARLSAATGGCPARLAQHSAVVRSHRGEVCRVHAFDRGSDSRRIVTVFLREVRYRATARGLHFRVVSKP